MSRLKFELHARASGSRARAGKFTTLHNEVLTPIFMPVGTQATVRAQTFDTLESLEFPVLLANTYHLMLRPGIEVFERLGGIHQFNGWKRSVLTDSGGFQIFSLPRLMEKQGQRFTINDEQGAIFRSYVDGNIIELTPERSIAMQRAIGSDIMMVLDQCVPSTCARELAEESVHRTHRWAKRSLDARGDSPQSLFGIVQGACYEDLRRISAEQITSLPFDGFAIGGLAVGESKAEREDFTELSASLLPEDRPRYLMGVGTPIDLLEAVHRGVDMFDCVLPSSLAQQGVVFTSRGRLDLRRGVYKFSEEKLDPACACSTCARYSRAYLSHLIKAREVLGWTLLGVHNLHFYMRLMREMRAAILEDRFLEYYHAHRGPLSRQVDEDNPTTQPNRRKRRADSRPLERGDYRVEIQASGLGHIRQVSSDERMHPVEDPREEARKLYVESSGLLSRIESASEDEPLCIWDVGLGAATNAMAAIRAWEQSPRARLTIISFERDLDPMRLATDHPFAFPHVKHAGPYLLLEQGKYVSKCGRLEWRLVQGDFATACADEPTRPDFVFYDPFSAKTDDAPLWSPEFFERLHGLWAGKPAIIVSYSNSTAVRATWLAAGFYVASGAPSARRRDTSLILTPASAATLPEGTPLLGRAWLDRWERSSAPAPASVLGASGAVREAFLARVRSHPQFRPS
jgi:queuine tRNA-ribosyltransferase